MKNINVELKKSKNQEYWDKLNEGQKDALMLAHNNYVLEGVLWDYNFEDFYKALKEYGIKEFIFASTWSSALKLEIFLIEKGCKIVGTKVIEKEFRGYDFESKKEIYKDIKGIVIKVK